MTPEPIERKPFRLSKITAHEFLCEIAENIDNMPDVKMFTIRFVDNFRVERMMSLELQPLGWKMDKTEH
jgi:hypothetical protein